MLHYRVGDVGRGGAAVGGARQLHLSFVSFQKEVELFQKYRQSWHERERDRGRESERQRGWGEGLQSRHCKRERGSRAIKKVKSTDRQRESAVCLNPVGFPSVRVPVLVSGPCGGQCRCVCVSLCLH